MFSVADLSEEQIETIKQWVADGDQMADVQKKLKDEFGFNVTYMDTRFVSLDLELDFQSEEEPEVEQKEDDEEVAVVDEVLPSAGGVTATLDQVAVPGSMVSGKVTFSDGMTGAWMIDEAGRPSVDPVQPGYQPTEADLMSFQGELQRILDGHV